MHKRWLKQSPRQARAERLARGASMGGSSLGGGFARQQTEGVLRLLRGEALARLLRA